MKGQNAEDLQRRLIDLYEKCLEYQDEWAKINQGLKLIPEHERRLKEIDAKFFEIEKNIIDIQHKVSIIESIPDRITESISNALIEPKVIINQIKERQEASGKVIMRLAVIGALAVIFSVSNLGIDKLMSIILKLTPAL